MFVEVRPSPEARDGNESTTERDGFHDERGSPSGSVSQFATVVSRSTESCSGESLFFPTIESYVFVHVYRFLYL
jgi:hypothetical protein